ncbi:MAG: hypothetical protein JNL80_09360 [Phycisphaerae bacterium]|jgi:copper chaperone CopZ|nr:hypothetical protein [Phycisphaerae bacterium]
MTTRNMQIDGMKGDQCVQEVNKALRGLSGVEVKSVNVGSAVLDCQDDEAFATAQQAVNDAGYESRPGQGGDRSSQESGSRQGQRSGESRSGNMGSGDTRQGATKPNDSRDAESGGTGSRSAERPGARGGETRGDGGTSTESTPGAMPRKK